MKYNKMLNLPSGLEVRLAGRKEDEQGLPEKVAFG